MSYRITVVDDLKMQLIMLRTHLEAEGYHVTTYQDSRAALNDLAKSESDLFILDIEMPDITGIDLAKAIRTTPHLKDVPILFFTSSDSKDTLKHAYEAGGTDFLLKGQSELELKLRVKNCLHSYSLNRSINKQRAALEVYLRVLFHDLATPLSIASNGLKIASTTPDPEKKSARMQGAVKAIAAIQQLLKDLRLFFYQEKNAEYPLIEDILSTLQLLFSERLLEKNITLSVNNSTPPGTTLQMPKSFFTSQVIGNFLSNAIKFSPVNASISLDITLENNYVCWQLRDHGTGIPAATLAAIQQGISNMPLTSGTGTSGEQGTGSGYMIARHFLDYSHGKVNVTSDANGTCVVVSVPTSKAAGDS